MDLTTGMLSDKLRKTTLFITVKAVTYQNNNSNYCTLAFHTLVLILFDFGPFEANAIDIGIFYSKNKQINNNN